MRLAESYRRMDIVQRRVDIRERLLRIFGLIRGLE
jgi:hypothetical protein